MKPINPSSFIQSGGKEQMREIVPSGQTLPSRESFIDPDPEVWQALEEWFQLPPLTQGYKTFVPQMLQSLLAPIIPRKGKESKEAFTYKQGFFGDTEFTQPVLVADLPYHLPRRISYGPGVKSWYITNYTLPEGSEHIHLIAMREDTYDGGKMRETGVEVHFAKQSSEPFFSLVKPAYPIGTDTERQYLIHHTWGMIDYSMGSMCKDLVIDKHVNDVRVVHIYNQAPEASAQIFQKRTRRLPSVS